MSSAVTLFNAIAPARSGERGCERLNIVFEGGKIRDVAEAEKRVGMVYDCSNRLVLPGMVNAHTHSSEMWMRGEAGMLPLELWLACIRDFGTQDPANYYFSAMLTAVETLHTGGTTVVDHLFPLPNHFVECIGNAVRAYRDVGIRAFVGPLIDDLPMVDGFPSEDESRVYNAHRTDQILRHMEEVIERYHRPEEGISIMVAPTGTHLCSDPLVKGCVALSEKYGLARHIHCLETKAQMQLAIAKYKVTAVRHLKDLGFLSPRTSCAHNIWLTDDDIQIYKETGTTAVHCPLSNIRLGSGVSRVPLMRRMGVNCSIGCDGAASNDSQDLLESVKMGMLIHNSADVEYRHWIRPHEAIRMASLGGFTGLGLQGELGSLEVGKKADIVTYRLDDFSLLPKTDPIGLLVMGRPVNIVDNLWVEGRHVVSDGRITTISEEWLRSELMKRSEWKLKPRDSPTMNSFESSFRHVMKLD